MEYCLITAPEVKAILHYSNRVGYSVTSTPLNNDKLAGIGLRYYVLERAGEVLIKYKLRCQTPT